jgi:hypothetical protein
MRKAMTHLALGPMVCLLTWGISLLGGVASAEEEYYPNPIDQQATFYYCSNDPSGGEYNVYPCSNSYRHSLYLSGFRARADLSDPRIRCQQELPVCTNDIYCIGSSVGGLTYPSNAPHQDLFRIYIPPGACNTGVTLFVPETAYPDVGAVARFGIPPTGDYSNLTFNDFPRWDEGYKLSELRKADRLAIRCGGHITISQGFYPALKEWEGGYLYVKIFYFGGYGSYVFQHSLGSQVSVAPYVAWYEKLENNIFYGTADDWAYFMMDYQAPVPQITGPGVVYEGQPVSIGVSLDPGSQAMQNADWWIVAQTSFGWYSYVYPIGWFAGIQPCVQTPLFNLTPAAQVLNDPLPAGNYTFYFALDNGADGVPDVTWLSSTQVTVLASTTTTTTTIPTTTTTSTTTTIPTTSTTTTLLP